VGNLTSSWSGGNDNHPEQDPAGFSK
jgi:hypothetical protein